jgi:branched-chain amino acid aminotransferase
VALFKPYPHAYIRGNFVPTEQATISIMTNGLHYGIGLFGGIKVYQVEAGVGIFRLDNHIKRLQDSCKILRFPYKIDAVQLKQTIVELVRRNQPTGTTYIRPLVYRSDTALSPGIVGDYDLAIYCVDMPEYVSADKGLEVCVSSWQRNADNALPPRTKATGGYLNSVLAMHDAEQAGYDSAILLDSAGNVGEGAVMNLFMIKNDQLITPSVNNDILEGVTRRMVIELANELNISVVERSISRTELYTADELLFCGTAVELAWCKSVDHVLISDHPGPVTQRLRAAWQELPTTHGEHYTILNKI